MTYSFPPTLEAIAEEGQKVRGTDGIAITMREGGWWLEHYSTVARDEHGNAYLYLEFGPFLKRLECEDALRAYNQRWAQ